MNDIHFLLDELYTFYTRLIITSNRNVEDWGHIFGDRVMALAIIDRIVHHAEIIKIEGDSFRTKNHKNDN